MQYSQEHLKTMVYAEFGGQTECIMGNWKIENAQNTHCNLKVAFLYLERNYCPNLAPTYNCKNSYIV